MSDKYNFKKW